MKIIKLTRNMEAKVSDEDYDWLMQWSWFVRNRGYAARGMKNPNRTVHMHREILERKLGRPMRKDEITDHINGDQLDNRRENLQATNQSINNIKKRVQRNNTSGYTGVYRDKGSGKWKAFISRDGRRIHLGYFSTPEDAYSAYLGAKSCIYADAEANGVTVNR